MTEPPILPLSLRDVCFEARGARLIKNLSFVLEAGPRTVLLGPNGAGKSLTLRLCHGLIAPTSGAVTWLGPGANESRLRQAMVFQRPVMLRRSAAGNLAFALSLRDVPAAERRLRVSQALAVAGLTPLAARQARVLSGGEQQRLALARAWALRPQVLFLDEPTANLDPASTRAIEELIAKVVASGTKIVMTTHDLGQARRMADEILFMHRGRLIERAACQSFFAGPRSREAAAFIEGSLLW